MHAILGTSDACIAVHPSDMCVALALLEAKVHVTGPNGARAIAFDEFHRLPGDTPSATPTSIRARSSSRLNCRPRGFASNYTYLKIRDRLSYAFALVSVAAALELDGRPHQGCPPGAGRRRTQAVARPARRGGACAAKPQAKRHSGTRADIVLRDARGFGHNNFKIELARRAIVRALTQAARGTPQSQSNKKIA